MKQRHISILLQQLLKNSSKITKEFSTTGNTTELLSCRLLNEAEITYNIKWSAVEKVHGETKIDHCPLSFICILYMYMYTVSAAYVRGSTEVQVCVSN